MTTDKTATILVIDHAAKSVTLDGREVADPNSIGKDIDVGVEYGIGEVRLTLFAENILIRGEQGDEVRPVAEDEARRIVRRGLRDVLAWLGEVDRDDG